MMKPNASIPVLLQGPTLNLSAGKRNGKWDGFSVKGVSGAAVGGDTYAAAKFASTYTEALMKGDKLRSGHDQPSNQTPPRSVKCLNVVWCVRAGQEGLRVVILTYAISLRIVFATRSICSA